mmetsp:Transcript_49871/g.83054  ORF Transcript_49871/g.83054 Transcript_49871/m.83054 type:complete len:214 (-) Transcript_49871:276-917(-)
MILVVPRTPHQRQHHTTRRHLTQPEQKPQHIADVPTNLEPDAFTARRLLHFLLALFVGKNHIGIVQQTKYNRAHRSKQRQPHHCVRCLVQEHKLEQNLQRRLEHCLHGAYPVQSIRRLHILKRTIHIHEQLQVQHLQQRIAPSTLCFTQRVRGKQTILDEHADTDPAEIAPSVIREPRPNHTQITALVPNMHQKRAINRTTIHHVSNAGTTVH